MRTANIHITLLIGTVWSGYSSCIAIFYNWFNKWKLNVIYRLHGFEPSFISEFGIGTMLYFALYRNTAYLMELPLGSRIYENKWTECLAKICANQCIRLDVSSVTVFSFSFEILSIAKFIVTASLFRVVLLFARDLKHQTLPIVWASAD